MDCPKVEFREQSNSNSLREQSGTALCWHARGQEKVATLSPTTRRGKSRHLAIFSKEGQFCLEKKEADVGLLKVQVLKVPLSALISYVCHGEVAFEYLSHISRNTMMIGLSHYYFSITCATQSSPTLCTSKTVCFLYG